MKDLFLLKIEPFSKLHYPWSSALWPGTACLLVFLIIFIIVLRFFAYNSVLLFFGPLFFAIHNIPGDAAEFDSTLFPINVCFCTPQRPFFLLHFFLAIAINCLVIVRGLGDAEIKNN